MGLAALKEITMAEIKQGIFWAGYIDWELRNFHGYSTPTGSSYNSYLIIDEMPTLIDTVKSYGFEEMVARIKQQIDPKEIRYIVSNHTEMDHSGTIGQLLELCPNAQVVCSPKGKEGLKRYFKVDWPFKVVEHGETLSIGKRSLAFYHTPMVHWPDNMVTYCPEEKILFSNDAFGQHHASTERYADQIGADIVFEAAAKYYANIVMPYGNQVQKAISLLSGVEIEMICPSHGLIWRTEENITKLLELYNKWSLYESEDRVLIFFDTMWHTTEKLAIRLQRIIEDAGIPVVVMNLENTDISDVITEVLRSKCILVGSSILNNRMLPKMAAMLTYLKGLKAKNRYGLTFGSYGWATVGFKEMEQFIEEGGIKLLGEGKYFKFLPDEDEMDSLSEFLNKINEVIR